jgi:hypothetical protein
MPSVALDTGTGASEALLERGAELSRLADRLEAVGRGGRGHVLLVGGEAGVGKTTLVRRFCEEQGRPARILWGACDPLFTPSPLGPLLAVAEGTGGELKAVVERGAMPYQVAAALARELSARPPTIFVLEDVHWADEATLDVLRLLARRVETVPALVVATYRDDELDRAHPLRILLGELATGRTVERMRLGRLSPVAVTQLAEPYGVDAEELYRKTAGNPFFVVEALAAGAEGDPGHVDLLPALKGGDSCRAAHAAPRWVPASLPTAATAGGLTPAPQAFWVSASPAATRMLRAAFTSRSWVVPHAPQVQMRRSSGFGPSRCPHTEQVCVVGSNRPILMTRRPWWAAFSASSRTNIAQPASWTLFASRVRANPATARSSTATAWFSRSSRRASLWWWSARRSRTRR